MSFKNILRILSFFLFGFSLTLLLPLGFSLYMKEESTTLSFLYTFLLILSLGLIFFAVGRSAKGKLLRKEAIFLVIVIYFLIGAIGGLPFYFSNTLANPFDAFFESVSGFTTTGATVLESKVYQKETGEEITIIDPKSPNPYFGTIHPKLEKNQWKTGIEAVSQPLLLWRSEMQWLGGGGIIILFVAILPLLGVGGKILYQVESTGPTKDSLAPRIKETAQNLWKIYLGLTFLEMILLMATNKNIAFFDALCVSFSTISTGGFSPKNASIAAYQSAATEWVVIIFMILGSINFSLYFFCMKGRWKKINDPELKAFFSILIIASLLSFFFLLGKNLFHFHQSNLDGELTFRTAAFQLVSAQTSTGFSTADYTSWPFSVQSLMLIVMYIGGMAGSTAGGVKVSRIQIAFKAVLNKIELIFRPDSIRKCRLGIKIIEDSFALRVLSFLMIVLFLATVGTLFLIWEGISPQTSFSTMACMLNNTGLGFSEAGPLHSFAFLSNTNKFLSTLWMILGRLEYLTVLVILLPAFWKRT